MALRHALVAGEDPVSVLEDRAGVDAVRDLAGLEKILGE
jgi:hypothetical protein